MLFFGVALAQLPKGEAETSPRYIHEPDLKVMLAKFLTPQGFLDQAFADATAKPSRFYSDFYGIQALANTTKEGIKHDFVPKFAQVVSENDHMIDLKFKNGWTGKFYTHSSLKILGIETKWDHVEVSGSDWHDLLKNLADLLDILQKSGLEKKYLRVNPHYKDELVVYKQMIKNLPPAQIKVSLLPEFNLEKNAIFFIPNVFTAFLRATKN